MPELISEPITPQAGTFSTAKMAQGEPGLPTGFTWRGQALEIVEQIAAWKHSATEATGQLYLRRHYYKLRMSDRSVWTVYFIRQTPRSGNPKARWFLYTVEMAGEDPTA